MVSRKFVWLLPVNFGNEHHVVQIYFEKKNMVGPFAFDNEIRVAWFRSFWLGNYCSYLAKVVDHRPCVVAMLALHSLFICFSVICMIHENNVEVVVLSNFSTGGSSY